MLDVGHDLHHAPSFVFSDDHVIVRHGLDMHLDRILLEIVTLRKRGEQVLLAKLRYAQPFDVVQDETLGFCSDDEFLEEIVQQRFQVMALHGDGFT